MRLRPIAVFILGMGALGLPAQAEPTARVIMSKGKQTGTVLVKVQDAGMVPLRVTVPWGVAQRIARAAHGGAGLRVSTAADEFTGNILRIVAGRGPNAILLERSRRAGSNGQCGSAALRYQEAGTASFIGRTSGAQRIDGERIKGRSSLARIGAVAISPYSLESAAVPRSPDELIWYARSTKRITTDPTASLETFRLTGTSRGVTARPARLITAIDFGF